MSILNLFRKPTSLWDEQKPLVLWNNREPWTIGDSFEGVQAWGDSGSGKTTTTAKVLATAMLRAGYGGLVLTVKPDDARDWRQYLDENGRSRDGIFFGPQEDHCFNFLDYELRHSTGLAVGSQNATRILSELVAMAQKDSMAGDAFWQKSARVLIGNTLDLISAAGVTPSLLLAKEIIDSAPLFPDQTKDTQWQAQSACWELLGKARQRAGGKHDFEQAAKYWLRDFPLLPDKTRQSIVATFTASVAQHFCSESMHRMFGGRTNVSPDDIFNGGILVVNLPKLEYHDAGRFASVVWKYCTQLALQRRANRQRPVFIFSDESHYFLTDHDQLFQTTARSARCAVVYLTQNSSNYFAESPGDAGRNRVASMAACLKTQVLHQCSHDETRRAFSDAIGKRRIMQTKQTHSYGQGKPRHGETEEPVDEYWVPPDYATRLKTGGKSNRYRVTAIVRKAGKCFTNGKPAMRVRFDQRKLERGFWAGYTTVAIPKPKQDQ
jgi:hypothetical protein